MTVPPRWPAKVFHPGTYLGDELDARNMSIEQFAAESGWPVTVARQFIEKRRKLTLEMCVDLERVLGTSAEMWANLGLAWINWVMREASND